MQMRYITKKRDSGLCSYICCTGKIPLSDNCCGRILARSGTQLWMATDQSRR